MSGSIERVSGAADNDPFGQRQQTLRLPPVPQAQEAVRPYQVVERRIRHLLSQGCQRIDRVVRGAVGTWRVDRGDDEARVPGFFQAGELDHREPIGEGSRCDIQLQGLQPCRGEDHPVQPEGISRRAGDAEMAAVRRVEGASEQGYAHGVQRCNRSQK